MHAIFGGLLTILAFVLAEKARTALPYFGLVNPAAMVLLVVGPIGITLISHPWGEWRLHLGVMVRAFRHRRARAVATAAEETVQLARATREGRWDEAQALVSRSRSEAVAALGPHLVSRLEGPALDDAIASRAYQWMAEVKGADEFLQGLGRLCPAFGMIGTIMGLVDLFAHMRDSASLGPGMAMALLATLYGLVLCYCVYLPLALRARSYLSDGIAELRLVERGLRAAQDGRPIHEVRAGFAEALGARAEPSA